MARKIFVAALPLVIIITFSYFAVRPLLSAGFFNHHDDQQVARLFQLDKALMEGQIPPRIVSDLGFGMGYVVFNFYPPLSYYFGEIFHLLGFGFIDSIKLVWLLAILGSGISMYLFAKRLVGTIGAVTAALFYIYAPYHAIDAYVRGALAELFSFVWLPLILLAVYIKKPVLAGIFLGLLMLTHNLIFLPFYGFVVLWTYLIGGFTKEKIIHNTLHIVFYTVVAFGLTAFFWMPSLAEKKFTLVDELLIKNLALYKIHYICPSQLWDSLWGYGGSVSGCIDGMSFKLGKLHLVISIFAFIIAIIRRSKVLVSCFVLLIISIVMTTQYSGFIWDNLPVLWYLQFPWRFLEFAALFSSILAGSVFVLKNKWLNISFAAVLLSVLLFFNAKLFQPQVFLSVADSQLTSDIEIKQRVSSTSFEYLPKGSPLTSKEYLVSKTKHFVLIGDFAAKSETFKSNHFEITGISTAGARLQINIANFPGWTVWINDKTTQISDNNKYKLITIDLPQGEIRVVGKFENTPIRIVGNAVSIIFIAGLLIYGYKRIKK